MPIPALVIHGAGFLASMALWEGIAFLFEHFKDEPGNEPEAIAAALQSAQQSASQESLWELNKDARLQESLGKQFEGINPQASLSQLSLMKSGVLDRTDPTKYPTLNYVTKKLGMRPDEFVARTSPTRMGDLTGMQKALPPSMREMNPNGG